MRAVAVRPHVTLSIAPQDLNIIVQRLEPLPDAERFDVIVATNILVYYDAFDQALALANISKMLRPGGYFITNYAVSPVAPLEPSASARTRGRVLRQAGKRRHAASAISGNSEDLCSLQSPMDHRNVGNICFSSSAVAGLPYWFSSNASAYLTARPFWSPYSFTSSERY